MRGRGFTLVELMVGLAILALLLLLALRPMTDFMGNSRIRNAADSIANGVRLAGVEAIKRNRQVQFILNPGVEWRVVDPDPVLGGVLQVEPFTDGNLTIAVFPVGTAKLTYSSFGQFLDPNPDDDSEPLRRVDVTSPNAEVKLRLRVLIDPTIGNVGMRVCNRDVPASAPDGCP